MATITKVNNNIVIQCDNASQPAVFSSWKDANVRATDDRVVLTIGNKGYVFTDNYNISPCGPLLLVNQVDIVAESYTNYQIADLIRSSVLTEDQFSGTPKPISGTTAVLGQFTAIQIDEDAVFDITAGTGTIMVDGVGDAVSLSAWSGVSFKAGTTKYGKFSQIKLASGKVTAYSNL